MKIDFSVETAVSRSARARQLEAIFDVPASERPNDVPIVREYRQAGSAAPAELIARFTDRLVDYKARVARVTDQELPSAIATACAVRGVRRLIAPADLPTDLPARTRFL